MNRDFDKFIASDWQSQVYLCREFKEIFLHADLDQLNAILNRAKWHISAKDGFGNYIHSQYLCLAIKRSMVYEGLNDLSYALTELIRTLLFTEGTRGGTLGDFAEGRGYRNAMSYVESRELRLAWIEWFGIQVKLLKEALK